MPNLWPADLDLGGHFRDIRESLLLPVGSQTLLLAAASVTQHGERSPSGEPAESNGLLPLHHRLNTESARLPVGFQSWTYGRHLHDDMEIGYLPVVTSGTAL